MIVRSFVPSFDRSFPRSRFVSFLLDQTDRRRPLAYPLARLSAPLSVLNVRLGAKRSVGV